MVVVMMQIVQSGRDPTFVACRIVIRYGIHIAFQGSVKTDWAECQ